jgi:hypothetical protein
MDDTTEYRIRVAIIRLEAIANEELYYYPDNDPDSWGYCVICQRNAISCECFDCHCDDCCE